jgi:hypothetical protein
MVNGFYAAGLAKRNQAKQSKKVLCAIHEANRLPFERNEEDKTHDTAGWSFPEFVNGKTLAAGGVQPMGWSAAGALIADAYLYGKKLFSYALE